MANHATNHPANGVSLKEAGRQNAISVKTIIASCIFPLFLAACGDSSPTSDGESGASANVNTNSSGDTMPPPGGQTANVTTATTGSSSPATVVATKLTPAEAAASCSAKSPPGSVKTALVSHTSPVQVPEYFSGMHVSLNNASWMPNAFAAIPAPTYDYGIVRNLRMEVDGLEERGFWRNIETSPGVYDWTSVDKWAAANSGHPILWMIYGTPSFYQMYPGEPARWPSWTGIASPPTVAGHTALKAFAKAVKARYGDQIAAFEVWNEPTLPWTGNASSYNDRWSPGWGAANGQHHAPFFSGSASDLANIAYTLNHSDLGVPILGAAFVDLWSAGATTVTRFLNAPVTLPGGSGTGKDNIQGLSTHFYDYNFDPEKIIQHIDGYQAKLDAAGVGHLPIWGTETGAEDGGKFHTNDARAPINVGRWVLLAAAKGMQSIVLYGHVSGQHRTDYLGDTIGNQAVVNTLQNTYRVSGSTICNAAVLTDGRVWVSMSSGSDIIL